MILAKLVFWLSLEINKGSARPSLFFWMFDLRSISKSSSHNLKNYESLSLECEGKGVTSGLGRWNSIKLVGLNQDGIFSTPRNSSILSELFVLSNPIATRNSLEFLSNSSV
jgi:hypothetical protein